MQKAYMPRWLVCVYDIYNCGLLASHGVNTKMV